MSWHFFVCALLNKQQNVLFIVAVQNFMHAYMHSYDQFKHYTEIIINLLVADNKHTQSVKRISRTL